MLRWAHYCITSNEIDKTNLKFNSRYAKLQFELENAIKRHQRLDGTDHFLTADRPK
jgi:hypothetical protein